MLLRFSGVKVLVDLIPTWEAGKPIYPDTKFETLVKEGWRKNELIFACISKKAATSSQIHLLPYRGDTPLPNHPIRKLLRRPNPYMGEAEFFSSILIYTDLAGRAVYEKQRDQGGRVIGLWPLRPDWVLPIPGNKQLIKGYIYSVPGMEPVYLDQADILDIRLFDPLRPLSPWPPVAVAARIGTVDNTATDFISLFMEKGGAPPGIIKTVQKLRIGEAEEIRRQWVERYGGAKGWAEPAVLDKDAEYQRVGLSFEEMGFESLDSRNEARICGILKVPPIIVNARVGLNRATYSNYREARSSWWEDDLVPIYESFIDELENQLLREFDPSGNLELRWDYTNVPALREERLVLWQRANEGLKMGGITVNEYRKEIGYTASPSGDVFLRQLNLVEIPMEHEPGTGGAPWEELAAEDDTTGGEDEGSSQSSGEEEEGVAQEEGKTAVFTNSKARKTLERRIQRASNDYFRKQRALIQKDLEEEYGKD
jgi:HK97 family phage portal protein